MLKITEELIRDLKTPLGDLYAEFDDALDLISSSNFLISVGDYTLNKLLSHNIYPNIGIIDNRIQRNACDSNLDHTNNILHAVNPPGTITDDLWATIEFAIKHSINDGEKYLIDVEGEEDLAVLPVILLAPEDTTVLYGQPNEGLVLLNAGDLKEKGQRFINDFKEI
ncbi:GTP-dependent dephospho-CoA kinase family protein [uncultured Methanobrevibacter sp.]|uniref:GTP-dependent dephospho-CoA kinase family protein n=1 Tax=uncultured Methanobrevibacter sp. TaxID=253161 RepID=UPI0025DE5548|nr:DUF359 domain-containing protein [uncultured Methanobrevibacter sp.]